MNFKELIRLTKQLSGLENQRFNVSLTDDDKTQLKDSVSRVKEALIKECSLVFMHANAGDDIHVVSGRKDTDIDDSILVCFAQDRLQAQHQFMTNIIGVRPEQITENSARTDVYTGNRIVVDYHHKDGHVHSFSFATNNTLTYKISQHRPRRATQI